MKKYLRLSLLAASLLAASCTSSQYAQRHKAPADMHAYFDHTKTDKKLVSAHRGGPYPGIAENSIASFKNALKYGPTIIELDVEMTSDSVMMMMHDNTLERTTTGTGTVRELPWKQVRKVRLEGPDGKPTGQRIPTFKKVLRWTRRNGAILTVDVKKGVPFEKVIDMIERTGTVPYAAVITYNLEDAKKVYQLNPDLMISVTIRNEQELAAAKATGIPTNRMIAFTGTSPQPKAFYDLLHKEGIYAISATFRTIDPLQGAEREEAYRKLWEQGVDIIATDQPTEAQQSLKGKK